MTECKRVHTLKGLAALAKFLGVYEMFKSLVKNYGLKWGGKNSDIFIIKRLLKTVEPNEVFEWVKTVKRKVPYLSDFMDLITITGLRYNEAIESNNLIVKLASEGKLNEYFNAEKQVLEHYRFKEIFIRRSKKVFISFVPAELVQRISQGERLHWNIVKKRVARRVEHLRFADIREVHGSIITKHLRQPEIDFLHGRISANVFLRHYFNPAWITDLKQRALKAASEILAKIN
jgi:intergrase/recombinase